MSATSRKSEESWTVTFAKALQAKQDWSDKDELLDVVYWGKQILSLFIGVLFGLAPVTGFLALISYLAISTVVVHSYVTKFQKVDEEEVGGFWELGKEGFGSAAATFMVTWITVYTTFNV